VAIADSPVIEITYVGGPTAVLKIAGVGFIVDPTFDEPGRDYRSGTVTLRKLCGPAVAAGELGPIDVALVSHEQHADNLDDAGRALVARVPLAITTMAGAAKLGPHTVGLAPWQERAIATPGGTTLTVTATPARHGPAGIERIVGDVIGFVISAPDSGEDLVYVTGDTVWYAGTAEVARRYRPRVVLLFAGAARSRGPFHLTMDVNDAVETAAAFESAALVPVHHEGWAHFTQTQDDLAATFAALGIGNRLHQVTAGATVRF
jgi:L-ascorbate metabolism protein UlaG (beta-lactamase superfamily)